MTDLQEHVEAPGRAELVKQVAEKIKETGVDYIYYQFVSVTGRIVGKGIPAAHWERLAEKGFQLVYGSTANLFVDRHGDYIGYGPESSELVGIPDPETFVQLPWDKRIGRVFCTLFRNREERENPGGALSSDCRGNLRRIHNEFQDKHGLDMRCGTEPEMMWLKRGEDGKMAGGVTKPNCYHIDQFEELRPTFMKVIEYSQQMGLDIIQGDHEDAPGQLELNTQFDDVLRNADRLTTYRQICAQVAREDNLIACFMSKPFMGVIKHLGALTSIGSSTVNSYRRLWDTGFWAPIFADWGYQNRTCALRVSAPGRFEYRSVDSMVNPYLMGAALLKSFDDGIDNNLDPGEAEERNIYTAMDEGKLVKKLPMSLGDALEELRNDEVIKSAMPGEMFTVYEHYKRDEWEKYNATVTDWDLEMYLDCLP